LGTHLKITVITVAFNSAKTISDTLDTVADQVHPDLEHLVLDGASKDDTVDIVRRHTNPKIRLISEPDKGIYDAMNKGLALATGEVVGFLNSDDFYADQRVLQRIAKAFEDPTVQACHGDLLYVTQDKSRVVRYWKSRPFRQGDFAKGWCPAHPTFYIRKSLLERLGPFDLTYKLASDVEFMMRYLERGRVKAAYLPHVLVRMRVGGATNESWRNIVRQNREIFQALRKHGLPYSTLSFWAHKLFSRLWQRLAGSAKEA
jgi:glycosyltransferase involved in cell wall biosynthesis